MSGLVPVNPSGLTPAQFGALADVPPEIEWLANITNPKTQRAYKKDVAEFFAFAGVNISAEVRTVTRAHVIAWRKDLETRELADTSVRRKLSALSSLFDYLYVSATPSSAIRWMASSARWPTATKARRRRSAMLKLENCWIRHPRIR